MKRIQKKLLFITVLLLFSTLLLTATYASQGTTQGAMEGHTHLLALLVKNGANEGMIAGLDLKVIPGNGEVFLQTFPMTQITTQASMRFAKQIACEKYELDCSKYDFLYTITSAPGVIGGPSAGAAAAVLTAAVLKGKSVNESISMTGTINSGGLIGPVGGLEKKIEAAARNGIKEVLIPFGMTKYKSEGNLTIDLEELGKELGIKVREVGTLEEAAQLIAGIKPRKREALLKIDEKYLSKMKSIAERLCNRTNKLKKKVQEQNNSTANSSSKIQGEGSQTKAREESEEDYLTKAKDSFEKEDYYSAASYCFRANVNFREESFANLTKKESKELLNKLNYILGKQKKEIAGKHIRTLTDIETYMAVMERIEEAAALLESAQQESKQGKYDTMRNLLALATERIFSAQVWAEFFDLTYDTRIKAIESEEIKESCSAKISEAEESLNYAKATFRAMNMGTLQDEIEVAYAAMRSGDNIMCLYKAAKVKAESDVLLALKGLSDANFNKTMELKLKAAQEAISKSLKKGAFPIIAYSYYEYAKSLFKFREPISPLFAEYALELASIDMYFRQPINPAITVEKGNGLADAKKRKRQEYLWEVTVTAFMILVLVLIWAAYEIGSRRRDKRIKAMITKRKRKESQSKGKGKRRNNRKKT
ncbi:hypothetical protein DRJ25_01775 [Candidatus Woesearchaeota archaeon]|nr:MAG: hypothetical protein DRJ25_01775 [Candidatus Woesearchaeota archaeon]